MIEKLQIAQKDLCPEPFNACKPNNHNRRSDSGSKRRSR